MSAILLVPLFAILSCLWQALAELIATTPAVVFSRSWARLLSESTIGEQGSRGSGQRDLSLNLALKFRLSSSYQHFWDDQPFHRLHLCEYQSVHRFLRVDRSLTPTSWRTTAWDYCLCEWHHLSIVMSYSFHFRYHLRFRVLIHHQSFRISDRDLVTLKMWAYVATRYTYIRRPKLILKTL